MSNYIELNSRSFKFVRRVKFIAERGRETYVNSSRKPIFILFLIIFASLICLPDSLIGKTPYAFAQSAWPQSWIEIDWDRNENGPADDWRDVELAYYQYDHSYLYLKLQCYDIPGKKWPAKEGRYKWFVDLDGNMYYSGGNVYDAEYLLFVEDADHDGTGEMYLIFDANNDNTFGEYEPWPPANYADYEVTDPDTGGWRIVAPNQIEMYVDWTFIGAPPSYWLFWSTDQQNPNLDQSPTTDRPDEEQRISVHNVVAISQTCTPPVVKQGEHVTIQVVIENEGTQTETFNVTCYFNNTLIGTRLVTNLAAGHQTTLAFDWNTADLPVGNYMVTAWADSSSSIVETNEVDNWCASLTIVTIEPALIHDVAAISQVPDKTSVLQGALVDINVTVSNLGDFGETFNVTCFYNGSPISYQTVANLIPETSTSIVFAWNTTEIEPCVYYILAMADSSNVIAEIDESNNNCTSFQAVTVYSLGQMGKLFVDKVKTAVISGEDPPVVGLPTVSELTIIVTNIGSSDVSNIIVNETISPDVTFISAAAPSQGSITALPPPKIAWNVGTLSPGANATLTFRISVTPNSLGLIYLNHKEDVTASGTDTFSGNTVSDIGDTDVTVTAIIRDVAAISQVPTSSIVHQNDTVTIDVTVKNYGNVSETFNATCYYDGNQIGVIRIYNLEAGGQTMIPFAWDTTGVVPGTYLIKAEADSSDEIAESNETNNMCVSPSTVKIVIHDISIVSQVPSPTMVIQGETVTIEVIVKNEGTELETFTVSCYYNETLLETKTVSDLGPNTPETLSFIWDTTGAPAGKYFINTGASTVSGEKDTDDNACLSMTSVTVTLLTYTLTILPSAGGTTNPIAGDYTYTAGDGATVEALHDPCYEFVYWLLDGSNAGSDNPTTVLMNSNHALQPVFAQITYDLTVSAGAGGTTDPVPGTYSYDEGTNVQIRAIPDANYEFVYWELDGVYNGTGNPTTVLMNENHTLKAVFAETHTLIITVSEGGETNPSSGTYIYETPTYVVVEAVPFTNYRFDHWELGGVAIGSDNPITIYVGSTHYLKAVFAYSPPSPSPAVPVGGYSISLTKQTPISHLAAYTLLVALFGVALIVTKRKIK